MKVNPPEAIRNRIREYASRPVPVEFSAGGQGAIIGRTIAALKNIQGLDDLDAARHLLWGWLLGDPEKPLKPMRSADIRPPAWNGLGHWVTELKDGEFVEREAFRSEIAWVLTRAKFDYAKTLEAQGQQLSFGTLLQSWTDNTRPIPSVEMENRGQVDTALALGGIATPSAELPLPAPAIHWCSKCGARPAANGELCSTCSRLDAETSDRPVVKVPEPVSVGYHDPAFD